MRVQGPRRHRSTEQFDARAAFNVALAQLDCQGTFCATGVCTGDPPALRVAGESIAWPLSPQQAATLLASPAASLAAHGRGSLTVLDRDVRDCWRFAPESLTFDTDDWSGVVRDAAEAAGRALGVAVTVRAELHDLLVYEPGGHFLPHRDVEKEHGMFATLVFMLPSAHEGGELLVSHNGSTVKVASAAVARMQHPRWTAFYADCEHELRPVVSGHRVALVYNLVVDSRERLLTPPQAHSSAARALAQLVRDWGAAAPEKLVYFLEHRYSQRGMAEWLLKGRDAAVSDAVRQSGVLDVCLASVNNTEHVHRGYDDFEVYDVIAPPDIKLPNDLSWLEVEESEFVQGEKYMLSLEPDSEDATMGNSGDGGDELRYRTRLALVLWPRARRAQILGSSEASPAAWTAEEVATSLGSGDALDCTTRLEAQQLARLQACVARRSLPAVLEALAATPSLAAVPAASQHVAELMCPALRAHDYAAALQTAIIDAGARAAAESERGAFGAWRLLAALAGVNCPGNVRWDVRLDAGGPELLAAMAEALVPLLARTFAAPPSMSLQSASAFDVDGGDRDAACRTLTCVMSTLASLKLHKLRSNAAKVVALNSDRFPPEVVLRAVEAMPHGAPSRANEPVQPTLPSRGRTL